MSRFDRYFDTVFLAGISLLCCALTCVMVYACFRCFGVDPLTWWGAS